MLDVYDLRVREREFYKLSTKDTDGLTREEVYREEEKEREKKRKERM